MNLNIMKCFHFYVLKCIKWIFLADFCIIIVMNEAQIGIKFIPAKRGSNNLSQGGYIYQSNSFFISSHSLGLVHCVMDIMIYSL